METYESGEQWSSQAFLRPFADEEARLAYLRRGVQEAIKAGDRHGENFLRLDVVSRLLNTGAPAQAQAEFEVIVLERGDRSNLPGYYATQARGLGLYQTALDTLRIGFEDEDPSDLTLVDAEEYKVRRIWLVIVAHKIGEEAFLAELKKLAQDRFRGIQIPLQDLVWIKEDVLEALRKAPPGMVVDFFVKAVSEIRPNPE